MKSAGTKDENKRIPMFWSATDSTGMTDGPQGMDAGIESSLPPLDEQMKDETSLLNYYKRALRLRNENPEIARGTVQAIDSLCVGSMAAITKSYNGSTIGIIYNIGEEETTFSLDEGKNVRSKNLLPGTL